METVIAFTALSVAIILGLGALAVGLDRHRRRLGNCGVPVDDPFELEGRDLDAAEVHGVIGAPLGLVVAAGQTCHLIAVAA